METIQLARARARRHAADRLRGRAVHGRDLRDRGQDREDLQRDQEALLPRARRRAPAAGADRRGDARLPARADPRRRAGGAALRFVGRRAVGRGLRDVRAAADARRWSRSCARTGVPVIYFGNGAATILDRVARVGADVYGVDWRVPIDEARARLGGAAAVQGNLDPSTLLGPDRRDRAARARHRPPRRQARARLQPGPRHLPGDADRGGRGAGRRGEGA